MATLELSLAEKLGKIKSPKLQNQQHTAVVLSAVEETLREQNTSFTPTAYFAALLSLLSQTISKTNASVNEDLAASVLYLLDLVAPYVPAPLLRSQFSRVVQQIAPILADSNSGAPLLRTSIGCLESLLVVQESAGWALPQTQLGPRKAMAALLSLAMDHRPKVRKRAQEALAKILQHPPTFLSLDHPGADLCAETALQVLSELVEAAQKAKKQRHQQESRGLDAELMHSLHLIKTLATASRGWPSKKIEPLCTVLMHISKSNNEYLTIGAFEVFENIFQGMADEVSSAKLPKLLGAITELKPAQNDSQLLPPWIAVLSRGYDVAAQVEPEATFQKLPELCDLITPFLSSPSHNIRISASECLISFLANCIPASVIIEPSVYDEKTFEKLAGKANDLLAVKYQGAWMEVFKVLSALFDALKWRGASYLSDVIKTVGELRGNDAFQGKKEADEVLGRAIQNIGPRAVLKVLPLNLSNTKAGQSGRAWILPVLRDHISNTGLSHFRSEFVPLSEMIFQKVVDHVAAEKTVEIKIFETLVHQIWSLIPGYCDLPMDLAAAFDQDFAELLSNLLYQQPDLRTDICRGLQNLVESNQAVLALGEDEEDLLIQSRVSKAQAQKGLDHLATFSGNLLAVLFNVYSQSLPQNRAYILQCINSYLSITPEPELIDTFTRVSKMFESELQSTSQTKAKATPTPSENKMPLTSHTLMDLLVTLSSHLPRVSYPALFALASTILSNEAADPQLIKKTYKLIPRLATSETGTEALKDRNSELQALILRTAETTPAPARRDRLNAISAILTFLPPRDLHFIPSVLNEVVLCCKETNEKARTAAFTVLVQLANKVGSSPAGLMIRNSLVPHMPATTPDAPATIEEFFTMVSAGLAGSSPHMVAASITALSRLLFDFYSVLADSARVDLLATIEMFLSSNNREIVRAVLGFVKVAVVTLPIEVLQSRMAGIIPRLMMWSKEHKGRLKVKVRSILERVMRKFGAAEVEKWVGEEDRKFVVNLRKERERNKRKRREGAADENQDDGEGGKEDRAFDNEFDKAVYGSDSESESGLSDDSEVDSRPRDRRKAKGQQQYIREDEDAPLDLLASNAMASISTRKPVRFKKGPDGRKAKTDEDGKLLLGHGDIDDDDDADVLMTGADDGHGVDAYITAVSGPDAVRRGQKGRLKVSSGNKRRAGEAVELDEDDERNVAKNLNRNDKVRGGSRGTRGTYGKRGRLPDRRGLGMEKRQGGNGNGRVEKKRGGGMQFRGRGVGRK